MKIKAALLALTLLAVNCLAFARDAGAEGAKDQPVAFVGVNVVPMDSERVIENQTVIVRGDRIAELGPSAKVKVPAGALRIEAKGKYLMPGLAEMHGHLPHPNQGEAVARSFLLLFVANGVTTVRGMFGFPNHPALREQILRGEVFGPRLYVAGPAMTGQAVHSPEEGAQKVREYKQAGFDLLKIHEGLSLATYDAIVKTAKEVGMPFGGHVPNDVGLPHALKSGQSTIEHLDGYVEELEADDSPVRNADPMTHAQKFADYLDERKIPALVAATREAGAWVVPTMALWQTFMGTEGVESLKQRPELKYMPPPMINQWAQQRAGQLAQNSDPKPAQRVLEMRNKVLKALQDSTGRVMLGSDAPQLFSVPGFSLHREMQAMVRAGLTPYQVLAAGTRNPAVYLKAESEFGTVAVGKRADLILVDDNPLKDVANVAKRTGVMLRGQWLPEEKLRKMLDDLAATYVNSK
ncbi:MAG TPA: amidohydrolase family protein [Blastocatellia bacterium]|nr:amidohydrolase family protein [Blastocatellia bacterium]